MGFIAVNGNGEEFPVPPEYEETANRMLEGDIPYFQMGPHVIYTMYFRTDSCEIQGTIEEVYLPDEGAHGA